MMRLTRRALLGSAAAGAAALALPRPVLARSGRSAPVRSTADVVVVGAGFAGLVAARRIARAGRDVVVLEARDRVGGRVLNARLPDGDPIEVGGQWVGPTQDRILALAAEVGVGTFPTYNDGQLVDYRNGQRVAYTGRIPPTDPAGAVEAGITIERLNAMAAEIDPSAPWASPRAEEWDRVTFQTWMDQNLVTPGGRSLVQLAIEAVWAVEPGDVSLLHVVFYIASAGDLNLLIDTEGGAQQDRFVGGSQEVALRVAAELGDRVVLGAPVRDITQHTDRVTVAGEGFAVTARRVIVALPPHLAGTIRYDPPLPPPRAQLHQRVPMGSVIKAMAIYDEPWWRAEGLNGQATSDTGPVKITFDNTPPDGQPGVLLGFFEADDARAYATRTAAERRDALLDSLARYFGPRARSDAVGYVEKVWDADPWSGGGYVGITPPGVLRRYGPALRAPVGRIHWAGTETADRWNGYMDGAVRSGERAAEEVLAALEGAPPPSGPPPVAPEEPATLPATGGAPAGLAGGALLLARLLRRQR